MNNLSLGFFTRSRRNLALIGMLGLLLALGCSGNSSNGTDSDAPKTERGRLKFAKGLHSLRIGDRYVFRDVTQYFFFEEKPWEPADDEKLADRINWCDTSPNTQVEILRCFSDSSENYRYTYIIRVKDGQPIVQKIDEGLGSIWIDTDGRWLLFKKFYVNVETGESIPIKGMPSANDPDGSVPVQYVIAVSPDRKIVIGVIDRVPATVGNEQFLKLLVIDTESGIVDVRRVSLTRYPWLNDHEDPANNIQPPPAASKNFVWKKDAKGRDALAVPELLAVEKEKRPPVQK